MVQSLVNEIDVIPPQSSIFNILSLLVAGLAFLGAPSVGASVVNAGVSAGVKAAANTAVVSFQQAPGLVKSLWPSGTIESRLLQVGSVNDQLRSSNAHLSQRITDGLQSLLLDVPNFIQFAGNGAWTGPTVISIPQQTDEITYAFENWITSLTLSKNGWYGILADTASLDPGHYPTIQSVEKSDFRHGITCDHSTYICTSDPSRQTSYYDIHYGYMPPDRNSAWWWSPVSHRLFALVTNKATDQLNSKKS